MEKINLKGLNDKEQYFVKRLKTDWIIPKPKLEAIITKFIDEMKNGLEGKESCFLMIPSYVTDRSSGQETGNYLALDFGGSNCRVCFVKLKGKGEIELIHQQKFKFNKSDMRSTGQLLFGKIAGFIKKFLESEQILLFYSGHRLNLGFIFSFPVDQAQLDKGILVRWTKGFNCNDVVGKEIVSLLQKSLDEQKVNVQVNALINDTVGTLLSSGYSKPSTVMGVILGTGTNAAYYENVSDIKKIANVWNKSTEMVINMEWGAFDNEKKSLPLTKYDAKLDEESVNPCEQIFEKTISGYYLGELFRLIVLDAIENGIITNPSLFVALSGQYEIDTEMCSHILQDSSDDLQNAITSLQILGAKDLSNKEVKLLQKIAEFVGIRAAQLSATAVVSVLLKRQDFLHKDVIIGVDGSVFQFYPYFKEWMEYTLNDLLGPEVAPKVKFVLASDGSGIGAALGSMIASKL